MTIYLSALGWIGDKPEGNRLRWRVPMGEPDGAGRYLGLPKEIIVERAPFDLRSYSKRFAAAYSTTWWETLGSPAVGGIFLADEYKLPGPVQAVSFVWQGGPARIEFLNGREGTREGMRTAVNGDAISVEGSAIDTIAVLGTGGTLANLRVLDLFRDRGLDWQPIAEIAVERSFTADLDTVAKRYGQPTTLSEREWDELKQAAQKAIASGPADAVPGEPTAWETLELLMGIRWEFALLCGFAYFDGPDATGCEFDKLTDRPLERPQSFSEILAYAYRVRDPDSGETSNMAVVPLTMAPPLNAPIAPQVVGAEVRVPEAPSPAEGSAGSTGSLKLFTPLPFLPETYRAQLTHAVTLSDEQAQGAELEEAVGASPTTGAGEERRSFFLRSHRPEDPPSFYEAARSVDVSFPDVRIRSRARALDAWDRLSDYSPWSAPVLPELRHEPLPPTFESVSYASGTASIVLSDPDWQPDSLVRKTGGRLAVYRQTAVPRTADAVFGAAVPAGSGLYRATVSGVGSLADFIGGTLSVGGYTETIAAVSGTEVVFRLPDQAGTAAAVFGPGSGRLVQDLKHPSLWTHVADFPAEHLPDTLLFSDPLPAPAGVSVVSYAGRLSYFGRLGPFGGIVRGLRYPETPVVPPPFTVEPLGIDFYHRTLLQLRFTVPSPDGAFTVWWCDGEAGAEELASRGAPGSHKAQTAKDGLYLYESLALPIPQHSDRMITIGVQRVGEGAQSDFAVVSCRLPALHG
ncbi:hypothetical protein [Cohnella zeiphila]|uniref:Uncharacterized protein n=1 Tax=Cohnella zeiphila TaxID=2761120 RepID=A0A7X0SMW0_9BACL|nr:hypothetical protein [Cohnella zeiphila]MBB6732920.1 hypothetical protein [Cohnella zeiphila]